MTIIIPDGYAQLVAVLSDVSFTDGEALCTMGVKFEDSAAADAAATWAEFLGSETFLNPLSAGTVVSSVRWITADEGGEVPVGEQGNNANPMPPCNSAVLVRKPTTARGRRGRGRNYWPNLVQEGAVGNNGTLDETVFDNLQTVFDAMFASLDTATTATVILQGTTPDQVTPPLDPPPFVTGFIVERQFGSQRRRMRR